MWRELENDSNYIIIYEEILQGSVVPLFSWDIFLQKMIKISDYQN